MLNTLVSSECSRRVEHCNSRPNAGCQNWPSLTLRLRIDSASLPCRIMHITTCRFITAAGTNACWQAALVPVECCSIAPQIHSKLQTFSTSTTPSLIYAEKPAKRT